MRTVLSDKKTVALAAACLSSLMFGLEISSVPVILPTLQRVLHGNFRDMQWIMNAYTIACTSVLMAAGTLADRYGRRRLFIITVVLFGLTSLVCGLAGTVGVLIVSRLLQGISGGAMLICQVAVLSQLFRDGRERSRAFGWWGIVFGVGLGFGPIIGGVIVAVSSWEWVFLVHVVLSGVTLLLIFTGVEESGDPAAKRLDVGGMVSLSVAVFCFTWWITQGGGVWSVAALVAAVVSLVIFLIVERRHAHPMFDFSVFRIREFAGAILGSMGMNFSFWPFMIYLPIYFQMGLGYGTVRAGLSLLAYTLPTLVVAPVGERLALLWRAGVVIPLGLFTIGVGFIVMRWGCGVAGASWLTMLPGELIAGIGLGLTNTPVTNTTTGAVAEARAGMASGIDMSARLITLAVNIALMGVILVGGVYAYLSHGMVGGEGLRRMAEEIAAGHVSGGGGIGVARAALVHGFEGVLLYGGIGVILLAGASFLVMNRVVADERCVATRV